MDIIFQKISRLIAVMLCNLIIFADPVSANAQDNADALFRSTINWVPLGFSQDKSLYADPGSILKIDNNKVDINLLVINSNNQYIPEETFTYRFDCYNNKFKRVGWRIGGYLTKWKPHWLWAAAEDKITVGSVMAAARDVVCGVSSNGENLEFLTSYWEGDQRGGPLIQVWIRDGYINVAEDNPNLRHAKLAARYLNSNQFSYKDTFAKCDRREIMFVSEGESSGKWLTTAPDEVLGAALTYLCSDTPLVGGLRKVALAAPTVEKHETTASTAPETQSVHEDLESAINEAKRKCAEIGFVAGTPKFGDCVLKISR